MMDITSRAWRLAFFLTVAIFGTAWSMQGVWFNFKEQSSTEGQKPNHVSKLENGLYAFGVEIEGHPNLYPQYFPIDLDELISELRKHCVIWTNRNERFIQAREFITAAGEMAKQAIFRSGESQVLEMHNGAAKVFLSGNPSKQQTMKLEEIQSYDPLKLGAMKKEMSVNLTLAFELIKKKKPTKKTWFFQELIAELKEYLKRGFGLEDQSVSLVH